MKYLRTVADGDIQVTSRTLDDKLWTVAFLMDDGPVRFYLYDREAKKAKFLFTNRKDLGRPAAGEDASGRHHGPRRLEAGLLSHAAAGTPIPTATAGRTSRCRWCSTCTADRGRASRGASTPKPNGCANRGYAVLSVNFRGSTGFGKEFVNAGNKEWAGKMHDDLLDAVDWAVEGEDRRQDKIAIIGGSYGGYATLVGLTFTPDVFACGVDVVGPSNILTLLVDDSALLGSRACRCSRTASAISRAKKGRSSSPSARR